MLNVESKEATIDGVNRAKLFLESNGRSKIIEGLLQHDNGEYLFLILFFFLFIVLPAYSLIVLSPY